MLRLSKSFFSHSRKLLHHQHVIPSRSSEPKQNLVILHGIMGYGKLYKHLGTNPKTAERFNSYLVDFRNHGNSFWHDHMSVEQMAHDVKIWLDAQHFTEGNVTMVGHSLGGRVLISLTEQYPHLSEIIKKIVIVDAAPHSYIGFPFVNKSLEFLHKLRQLDFKKSDEEILQYVKSICSNQIQATMVRLNLDLTNRKFIYNLDVIIKDYIKLCEYGCKSSQWPGDVHVIKALKAGYVLDHSKKEFKQLYKNLKQITDVDCYHNVHLQRPYDIIKTLYK